ncbi:unnamed protein product [Phytomonas sp. EM1]|nr:unnamed protein product [Phytomonas sp. EM1]|eukprot:CCW60933.1 unnamed protein product [Phytomonas sp. isolate EM1]
MLRNAISLLMRRKHSQKAWSPQVTNTGAAPPTGITSQEALQIVYRPMPPEQTVEYEEDFGTNLMIHREFISKKRRDQMSFDISPLVYSDVELRRGQKHLAGIMNKERNAVPIGMAGSENDRVPFNVEVDPKTKELQGARYFFNENRMRYCDRFQEFFHTTLAKRMGGDGMDTQFLFSLMEACAIIYGCDTHDAREVYYQVFGSVDLDSLERDEQELRQRRQNAADVQRNLCDSSSGCGPATSYEVVQETINSLPSLFEDEPGGSGTTIQGERHLAADAGNSDKITVKENNTSSGDDLREYKISGSVSYAGLPPDYAMLYKAYLAHARGESPIASYDISTLAATESLVRRRRWRHLMEKLVREDYLNLSDDELKDATLLNEQLHTIKFMDLKVGDTVQEILALLQRETGDGGSSHRDTPLEQLPSNPERRL